MEMQSTADYCTNNNNHNDDDDDFALTISNYTYILYKFVTDRSTTSYLVVSCVY